MSHKSTILIVDDTESARDLLKALLIGEGYRLEFAADGLEALEKIDELRPDLVLLDVMMPGMNGFEVCRRIRADEAITEIPIILVTALNDRNSRLQGLESGADDFVSKPYDRVELQTRVRTVTRLNRYRRLVAEQAKFEWVVEHAGEGYLIVSDQDEITYANPQARLFLGLTAQDSEPFDKPFLELAQRQYQLEPEEAWRGWSRPSGANQQALRYLVCPETELSNALWLQVDTLEASSGKHSRRLIRLRDVTAEVESRRRQRTFQSLVSHKLRTPAHNIVPALNLLELEDDTSAFSDLIAAALEGAKRLQNEVEDILRYAEAPLLTTYDEESDGWNVSQLPSLVREISSALEMRTPLVTTEENLRDAQVRLSRQALEIVLWEILENAVKFHPQRAPTVDIRASRLDQNQVSVRIRDDGRNLSPEQLAQMWTPYYQGEKYFTGEVPGMGLGLSVVASIVWSVGGTCRARNREDRPGIVVELTLPAA